MCDKVILENGGTLMFVHDFCKNKLKCNKAVDNYAYLLEFLPYSLKTCKMSNKAIDTYPSAIICSLIK